MWIHLWCCLLWNAELAACYWKSRKSLLFISVATTDQEYQCIFPVIVMAYVFLLPESPRWLIQRARRSKDPQAKQKYLQKAWKSFERLRRSRLQAARDMFLVYHMLENEYKIRSQHNRFTELFTNGRNRRAVVASTICLFFQQFCGV